MNIKEIQYNYLNYYESIDFEREELFECIRNTFKGETIVYLGSSIHVTPSFYFQNVTYIDKSPLAQDFFKETGDILSFINSRKKYKTQSHINYLNRDYIKEDIPVKYKFDIGISLFAPDSFLKIQNLVRKNGIIIYLPLPSDLSHHKDDKRVKLLGTIFRTKGGYRFQENKTGKPSALKHKTGKSQIFVENNLYQVYTNI